MTLSIWHLDLTTMEFRSTVVDATTLGDLFDAELSLHVIYTDELAIVGGQDPFWSDGNHIYPAANHNDSQSPVYCK